MFSKQADVIGVMLKTEGYGKVKTVARTKNASGVVFSSSLRKKQRVVQQTGVIFRVHRIAQLLYTMTRGRFLFKLVLSA